jgi:apolipoprotein N-acyltransferase
MTLPLWGIWAASFLVMFAALALQERCYQWRHRRRR